MIDISNIVDGKNIYRRQPKYEYILYHTDDIILCGDPTIYHKKEYNLSPQKIKTYSEEYIKNYYAQKIKTQSEAYIKNYYQQKNIPKTDTINQLKKPIPHQNTKVNKRTKVQSMYDKKLNITHTNVLSTHYNDNPNENSSRNFTRRDKKINNGNRVSYTFKKNRYRYEYPKKN